MQNIGYFNGTIGNPEEMVIPLCDRSVFFGDAVYDAVMILDQKPFTLDLHLDRLYNSCRMTEIPFTMERGALEAGCPEVRAYETKEEAYEDIAAAYGEGMTLLLKASLYTGRFEHIAAYLKEKFGVQE